MLFKHVPPELSTALSEAYIWLDQKQHAKLQALRDHVGETVYYYLLCAFVHDEVLAFEKAAEIRSRSGRYIIPLVADVINHYMRKNNLL